MPKLFEIGTVCVITQGRRAGKKVVVSNIIDENYLLVTGPKSINGIKRRRMNIKHLMPIDLQIDIEREADDDTIEEEIKNMEVEEFMKEVIDIPAHRL